MQDANILIYLSVGKFSSENTVIQILVYAIPEEKCL